MAKRISNQERLEYVKQYKKAVCPSANSQRSTIWHDVHCVTGSPSLKNFMKVSTVGMYLYA